MIKLKPLLLLTLIGGLLQGAPLFYYEATYTKPTTIGSVEVSPYFTLIGEYRLEIQADSLTTNVYSTTLDFLFPRLETSYLKLSLYHVKPGNDKLIKTTQWNYRASIPEPTTMVLIILGGLVTLIVVRIKRGV